jgi:hypothetical protein
MTGGKKPHSKATMIKPGAYPVMNAAAAMGLLHALRDPKVGVAAARVIADKADELRAAVLEHIDRVEDAARGFDVGAIYAQAHEIRGLAGNAGLAATGRIANVLCKYLDAFMRAGRQAERGVIALHLEAIARAAHAEDEATRLGDAVAKELSQLVERKLAEINGSETK